MLIIKVKRITNLIYCLTKKKKKGSVILSFCSITIETFQLNRTRELCVGATDKVRWSNPSAAQGFSSYFPRRSTVTMASCVCKCSTSSLEVFGFQFAHKRRLRLEGQWCLRSMQPRESCTRCFQTHLDSRMTWFATLHIVRSVS